MGTRRADPATRRRIEIAANRAKVDPDLLEAVYNQESSANPYQDRHNDGGTWAYGPFQIHEDRARDNGFLGDPDELVPNPLYGDPNFPDAPAQVRRLDAIDTNVDLAAQSLADNKDVCGDDPSCLVAGYNRPAAIRGSHPLSPQQVANTQNYTNSTMQHYADIKGGTYTAGDVISLDDRNKSRRYSPDRVNGPSGDPVYEGHCLDDEQEPGMFPEGAPLPPNPNHATCQFQIGGQRNAQNGLILGTGFSLTPARPQYVEYFEYIDNMGVWTDTFRLRVFDPSWDVAAGDRALRAIQQARTEAGVQPSSPGSLGGLESVLLSWGYVGYPGEQLLAAAFQQRGMWSGVRQAFIIGYNPHFLGTGVEIELTGQATDVGARLRSRSVTYPTRSGATSISEIVKQIAIRNGWRYCIRPTLPIYEGGEPKKFTQAQKDDLSYIQYDLIPLARAADNPAVTGYVVYYNSQTNTLHFHPPKDGQIVRHYTYARQRLGTIIAFNPKVQPALVVALGGGRLELAGIDQHTKEVFQHVFDKKPGDDPSSLGAWGVPDRATLHDLEKFNRQQVADAGTSEAAKAEAQSMYRTQQWAVYEADLTIVGDPTIRSGQLVRVTVFGEDSMPHWASGVFRIQQATHVIDRGTYQTTLQLFRDSMPVTFGTDFAGARTSEGQSTGADASTQQNLFGERASPVIVDL